MDQRWADLYAAVARQAVHDLQTGYTHPRHMDATHWLEAAGLLEHARTNGPVRRAGRTRGVSSLMDVEQAGRPGTAGMCRHQ